MLFRSTSEKSVVGVGPVNGVVLSVVKAMTGEVDSVVCAEVASSVDKGTV